MSCDDISRLLDAFVDQELFLKDSLDIEKHVKACKTCENKYNNMLAMKKALKACRKYKPGVSLQDNIQTRLKVESNRPRLSAWADWFKFGGPSFAMGVVLMGLLSFGYVMSPSQDNFSDDIVGAHIRSMMASHITDVATADKHQMKPWLNTLLDFSPPIEDLTETGYPLLGARLDYVNHRQVVALVYKKRNHFINLFIWPIDAAQNNSSQMSVRGYEVHSWSSDKLAFTAVSDLNRTDMRHFIQEYITSTKPAL